MTKRENLESKSDKFILKKLNLTCAILLLITCYFLLSIFLNRAKFLSPDIAGHYVNSANVMRFDDREFLIVLIGDTFPNSTETAYVENTNDQLRIHFKSRTSLFPELPFVRSKNTFGLSGDWDHIFAFELSHDTNSVVDVRSGEVLWERF